MQPEQEQRENRRVHALGIDLHRHRLPNAISNARILQQASIAQQSRADAIRRLICRNAEG
jgi:hypothetical protein